MRAFYGSPPPRRSGVSRDRAVPGAGTAQGMGETPFRRVPLPQARPSRQQLSCLLQRSDEVLHFLVRVVERERSPQGGGDAEELQQRVELARHRLHDLWAGWVGGRGAGDPQGFLADQPPTRAPARPHRGSHNKKPAIGAGFVVTGWFNFVRQAAATSCCNRAIA